MKKQGTGICEVAFGRSVSKPELMKAKARSIHVWETTVSSWMECAHGRLYYLGGLAFSHNQESGGIVEG